MKTVKLDKKQRTMIRAMPCGELFALISHFCQEKVETMEKSQQEDTREILAILEAYGSMPNLAERDGRNLRKTLGRMNFSSLISLALNRVGDDEAVGRLSDAFETRYQKEVLEFLFCLRLKWIIGGS